MYVFHICTDIYRCVCDQNYTHIKVRGYTYAYTYLYTFICLPKHTCIYKYMYICIYLYRYLPTYLPNYLPTYLFTCMCIHLNRCYIHIRKEHTTMHCFRIPIEWLITPRTAPTDVRLRASLLKPLPSLERSATFSPTRILQKTPKP